MWKICDLRNQVCLELVQINIERAVETEGSRDRRNDLRNESVEVGEAGRRDVQVLLADVINSLVVDLNHVNYYQHKSRTPRVVYTP